MVATRRDADAAAVAFDSTPKRIQWREVFQVRTLPSVRRLLSTAYSTCGQDHIFPLTLTSIFIHVGMTFPHPAFLATSGGGW
jgi:hypothetical protein